VSCSGCSTFAASAWARNLGTPVRDFLRAETGGAVVLVGAALVALAWANSPRPRSYEAFWTTELALSLNDHVLSTETCAGL
jgi:Na+/H+ antiporter NhaA